MNIENSSTAGQFTNIGAPPLEETLPQASAVVVGAASTAEDGVANVLVDRVLKGDVEVGEVISVAYSGTTDATGVTAVWVLGAGDPASLLAGGPDGVTLRQVERALAGLPAVAPMPEPDRTRDQIQEADAVVLAVLVSQDGLAAEATVTETFKGNAPSELSVVAAGPDGPGGGWTFPENSVGIPGLLILRKVDGIWTAVNDVSPVRYTRDDALSALD